MLAAMLSWADTGLHLLSGNARRRPWCRIYYDGIQDMWQVFAKVWMGVLRDALLVVSRVAER
jgi:hypothetical protein